MIRRRIGSLFVVLFFGLPQLAVFDDPDHLLVQYYQSRALGVLTPGEAQQWHAAMAQARAQGNFVVAVPHHCAVGTRP